MWKKGCSSFEKRPSPSLATALFTDIINDFYNIAASVCSASIVVERSRSIVDIAKGDTFVCKYFRPPASFEKIDYCRSLRKSCKIMILVIFGLVERPTFCLDMNCNSITFQQPFQIGFSDHFPLMQFPTLQKLQFCLPLSG